MTRIETWLFLFVLAAQVPLACAAGNNVHSNTILGAPTALLSVPPSAVTPNTFYSVGALFGSQTIDEPGCP